MKIKISDYVLERYLLKELTKYQMEEISGLANEDPVLNKRLRDLENDNAEILKKYPGRDMAQSILDKAAGGKQTSCRSAGPFVPFKSLFPVIAVLFLVLISWPVIEKTAKISTEIDYSVRMKGEPARLYVYRKNGSTTESLLPNSKVREKDLLQLVYLSNKPLFGVIFSIDGNGEVTLHYPENDKAGTALAQNKKTPLSRAYELDSAPSFERFFLVASKNEINVKIVLTAAKLLAASPEDSLNKNLVLDNSYLQYSIILRKVEKSNEKNGHTRAADIIR